MSYAQLHSLAEMERERQQKFKKRIFCCTSTACLSAGAAQTMAALDEAVNACQCDEHEVETVSTGCMGLCSRGPLIRVETQEERPVLYGDADVDTTLQVVAKHIPIGEKIEIPEDEVSEETNKRSQIRENLLRVNTGLDLEKHIIPLDHPFFNNQVKSRPHRGGADRSGEH